MPNLKNAAIFRMAAFFKLYIKKEMKSKII